MILRVNSFLDFKKDRQDDVASSQKDTICDSLPIYVAETALIYDISSLDVAPKRDRFDFISLETKIYFLKKNITKPCFKKIAHKQI